MFHCAYKQQDIDILYHLTNSFGEKELSLHYFNSLDELLVLSQRYHLDLVIVAGKGDFIGELDLVGLIKNNIFLSIIPTILYHPDPSEQILVAGFQKGADEFLSGEWRSKLFQVRLLTASDRSRRDISFNPSTALPGPNMIENEIDRLLKLGEDFAVCYADLDDFKPYNDYYGYYSGDRMIRITARIIRDVVFDTCREGFVGHVGGDDFMFIIPPEKVAGVCENIIKVFDTIIPYRYAEEDRNRGNITTRNRKGEVETFPFLTISIAVLINQKGAFSHVGEMSHMLADLKKYTKSLSGSNFVIERRKKY
jgi:GGDEF domain-containing protein